MDGWGLRCVSVLNRLTGVLLLSAAKVFFGTSRHGCSQTLLTERTRTSRRIAGLFNDRYTVHTVVNDRYRHT